MILNSDGGGSGRYEAYAVTAASLQSDEGFFAKDGIGLLLQPEKGFPLRGVSQKGSRVIILYCCSRDDFIADGWNITWDEGTYTLRHIYGSNNRTDVKTTKPMPYVPPLASNRLVQRIKDAGKAFQKLIPELDDDNWAFVVQYLGRAPALDPFDSGNSDADMASAILTIARNSAIAYRWYVLLLAVAQGRTLINAILEALQVNPVDEKIKDFVRASMTIIKKRKLSKEDVLFLNEYF